MYLLLQNMNIIMNHDKLLPVLFLGNESGGKLELCLYHTINCEQFSVNPCQNIQYTVE